MITQASFFLNPADNITPLDTVKVQPLTGNMAKAAVGRAISKVSNGHFPVELLNPYDTPITVKSNEILGHICFTDEEEVNLNTRATDIVLSYGGEDKGYESEEACSVHTTPTEAPPPVSKPPKEDVPPDLKIDHSSIAKHHLMDYEDTNISNPVPSHVGEGEFERISEQEDFMCSSFAVNKPHASPLVSDVAVPMGTSAGSSGMTKFDWVSSQVDDRGHNFHKYVTCMRKEKERLMAQLRNKEGDSSD